MAKVATLVDQFTSFTTASGDWTNSYGTPTLTSGQIHLSCVSGYEGLLSSVTYDVSDSSLTAEFPSIPTGGGNSRNTELTVRIDANNWISIGYVGTQMYCRQKVAGTVTDWATFAYNATNHRWWRFTHTTGTGVRFYTSPDGFTWTQQGGSFTTTLTLTAMSVHIFCGYFGTETSPPDAVVDNVNVQPAGGAAAMQLSGVSESFAGTVDTPSGSFAMQLGGVSQNFAGVASPPSGDIAMQLSGVSQAFAATSAAGGDVAMQLSQVGATLTGSVNPIGAVNLSLNQVTFQLGGETVPFGAQVIRVEPEKRALRINADDTITPIYPSQVTDA